MIHVFLYWFARLIAAIIMVQTLYFKFTGAEESIYIFSTIGMEPWGRIGVGVLELIASILLFIPGFVWAGALLAIGLMAGAIVMHLVFLGIEVQGDGGQLFIYSIIVLVASSYVYWKSKDQLPAFLKKVIPLFLQ